MIRGMFRTFGMEESRRDDYDIDACLEHSEEEMQESFLEFYHDVLPEFKSVGKVLQFKVRWHQEAFLPSSCLCCKTDSLIPLKNIYRFHLFLSSNRSAVTMNHTWEETFMFSLTRKKSLSHFPSLCNWSNTSEKTHHSLTCLSREEQCKDAFIKFNGRWYAGRQLHCEISPVTRWKNAICGELLFNADGMQFHLKTFPQCLACLFIFLGLFDRHKCPKGKHCNFLHVFRNPGNEFWEADRDLHMSPDRSVRGSHRDGWHSSRSWRQRHYSRSPVRSERSERRRDEDRRRSRSRERRPSYHNREDTRSSRSRHSDWWKDRRRSRSRGRSRSRSRDDEQDRRRNRSRDREKEHRGRDQERNGRGTNDVAHMGTREKSRSKERSPKSPDKSKKKSNDDSSTHRRHKHSKKSKKKSKKSKKKSHLPEETASSGESEKEESGEETVENLSTSSPGGERNEMERTQKNSESE